METFKFYIQKITKSEGSYTAGTKKDLETDFSGLHYKSITGMETYGKPRPYVENYAEQDMALVEMPDVDTSVNATPLDQTDVTLTLYFFNDLATIETTQSQSIAAIDSSYHSFVEFISGAFCLYSDTARKRKALLYVSDKIEPKVDCIKGLVYKEVEIKFKNVFGRSFDINDTTIETILDITSNDD